MEIFWEIKRRFGMTGPISPTASASSSVMELGNDILEEASEMEERVRQVGQKSVARLELEDAKPLTAKRLKLIKERANIHPFLARAIAQGGIGVFNGDPRIQAAQLKTQYNVKPGQATNQESSGRCWIFAGLNRMRLDVLKRYGEEFSYSQSYIAFWDKFERCNAFLEKMVELRSEDVQSQRLQNFLSEGYGDGGEWEMFVNIVQKYGVVPKSAMPETEFSGNTSGVNEIIEKRLREVGGVLHQLAKQAESEPALIQRVEEIKQQALTEIYRVLVSYWGEPPSEFYWQDAPAEKDEEGKEVAASKEGAEEEGVPPKKEEIKFKKMTPLEFLADNPVDIGAMVHIAALPYVPKNKRFVVQDTVNVLDSGRPCGSFNVSMEDLKIALRASIKDGKAAWIGSSMDHLDREKKLLSDENDKIDEIFGFDKEIRLAQKDALWYGSLGLEHAMLVIGCDEEAPLKVAEEEKDVPASLGPLWKVENSWGEEMSEFFMTDHWFDTHVFEVVVDRKYLPSSVQAALDSEEVPLELPNWDPYA